VQYAFLLGGVQRAASHYRQCVNSITDIRGQCSVFNAILECFFILALSGFPQICVTPTPHSHKIEWLFMLRNIKSVRNCMIGSDSKQKLSHSVRTVS